MNYDIKIDTQVNLYDLDIKPADLAAYINSQHSIDYDSQFMNEYLFGPAWSDQELKELAEELSFDVIHFILRLAETLKEKE